MNIPSNQLIHLLLRLLEADQAGMLIHKKNPNSHYSSLCPETSRNRHVLCEEC